MGKRISIFDDDADILTVLSMILEEDGYEVTALSTGENVFEEIKKFHPDLILMDVMLGNMDGRSICKQLKSNAATKALPVILISGTHDLADSLNQLGAPNDFIPKPFDMEYLLHKVKQQL